jgi:hypothetical protein
MQCLAQFVLAKTKSANTKNNNRGFNGFSGAPSHKMELGLIENSSSKFYLFYQVMFKNDNFRKKY